MRHLHLLYNHPLLRSPSSASQITIIQQIRKSRNDRHAFFPSHTVASFTLLYRDKNSNHRASARIFFLVSSMKGRAWESLRDREPRKFQQRARVLSIPTDIRSSSLDMQMRRKGSGIGVRGVLPVNKVRTKNIGEKKLLRNPWERGRPFDRFPRRRGA